MRPDLKFKWLDHHYHRARTIFKNILLDNELITVDNIKSSKILDLGANEGRVHTHLKNMGVNALTVDIEGNPDIKADLDKKFPFSDGSVDAIIAGELIEHLESPFHFLSECQRILKPKGRLVLSTPNAHSIIIAMYPYHDQHLYEWSIYDMKNLLTRVGLRIVRLGYFNSYAITRWSIVPLALGKLIPKIAPKLLVVVEKGEGNSKKKPCCICGTGASSKTLENGVEKWFCTTHIINRNKNQKRKHDGTANKMKKGN